MQQQLDHPRRSVGNPPAPLRMTIKPNNIALGTNSGGWQIIEGVKGGASSKNPYEENLMKYL
jgi:hypothetical protein